MHTAEVRLLQSHLFALGLREEQFEGPYIKSHQHFIFLSGIVDGKGQFSHSSQRYSRISMSTTTKPEMRGDIRPIQDKPVRIWIHFNISVCCCICHRDGFSGIDFDAVNFDVLFGCAGEASRDVKAGKFLNCGID